MSDSEHRVWLMRQAIKGSFEDIETLYRSTPRPDLLRIGFEAFDDLACGWHRGDVAALVASPGVGKSTFALQTLLHAATEWDQACTYMGAERRLEVLTTRMVCIEARVDMVSLRAGVLGELEWARVIAAAGRLSECPLGLMDSNAWELEEVLQAIRADHEARTTRLVVVDNMHLIRVEGSMMPEHAWLECARALKELARDLNITILVTTTVNTQHGGGRMLADRLECLEQADLLLAIRRIPGGLPEEEGADLAEVEVRKDRAGSHGTAQLRFVTGSGVFADLR